MKLTCRSSLFCCLWALVLSFQSAVFSAPGDLDLDFHPPTTHDTGSATVTLPDGSLLSAAYHTGLPGAIKFHVQRLVDGVRDESFPLTNATGYIRGINVQHDGKILIHGPFNEIQAVARQRLARLLPTGALDGDFAPEFDAGIQAVVLQPNGKILAGGYFSTVNGQPCQALTRLNEDGTTDATFTTPTITPNHITPDISQITVQPNGKILIAGQFDAVAGVPRSGIARLNADGTLDTTFNPGVNVSSQGVECMVLQADGSILVASDTAMGIVSLPGMSVVCNVIRLLETGAVDPSFGLVADGEIHSLALQSDGGILISGFLQYVNSDYDYSNQSAIPRKVVRVNPLDGSTDASLQVISDYLLARVSLQPDGKLLLAGSPNVNRRINGVAATGGLLRVHNGPAVNQFLIRSDSHLDWIRGGTAPEPTHVIFDVSVDGNRWERLGTGSRNNEGWQLSLSGGKKLPADCMVRARARIPGGDASESSGIEEQIVYRGYQQEIAAIQDHRFSAYIGSLIRGITAEQPDGKVLVGAKYAGSTYLLRLDPNGTPESGFSFTLNGEILAIAVQNDGRILVGGSFTQVHGQARGSLARLNADGTLDTTFTDPSLSDPVRSILLQKDGNILVGRDGGMSRFLADGTPDTSFVADEGIGAVSALGLQPDGKILVGCSYWEWDPVEMSFGLLANNFYRLETDGTLDVSFHPDVEEGTAIGEEHETSYTGRVDFISVLPDGKILIAGDFLTVGGVSRANIAMLNSDGSLVSGFNVGRYFSRPAVAGHPAEDNVWINGLAVQTDGKIIASGQFKFHRSVRSEVDPGTIEEDPDVWGLYCFDADGRPDPTFRARKLVETRGNLLILKDGRVLTSNVDAYFNQSPQRQLLVTSPSHVEWTRQGTHPEAQAVTFDYSADRSSWTSLGATSRTAGGWEWNGSSLPASGWMRARAQVASTNSSGIQERILVYPATNMAVSGNGVPIQNGSFFPTATDHTEFPLSSGTSLTHTYTLQNTGGSPLEITAIDLEGQGKQAFVVSGISLPATIAPSAAQTFTVKFTPFSYESVSATVAIESNGSVTDPFTFAILGTRDVSRLNVIGGRGYYVSDGSTTYATTDGTDIGTVSRGDSKSVSFNVSNSGSQPLTISSIAITGPDASSFTVTAPVVFPLTLYPSDYRMLVIRVQPTTDGYKYAKVTINNDHPEQGTFDFEIRAFATTPVLEVSGNGLVIQDGDASPGLADHTGFLDTHEGSSSSRTFTAANTGNADFLKISNVQISGPAAGDFSVNWTTANLAHPYHENTQASSKDLVVTFTPTKYGRRKATLTFTTNEPGNNQYSFDLQGQGMFRRLEVVGNGSVILDGSTSPDLINGTNFGSTVTTQTAWRMFTLRNAANISVEVTGLSLTGTGAASYVATKMDGTALSWPLTLDEGESLPVKVSFTPTAAGIRLAKLKVSHDNPDTGNLDYDFDLVGEGVSLAAVETAFNPAIASGTSYTVSAIATQADGKILIGGNFNNLVAGTTRSRMARLNANGTLDSGFDPKPNNLVNAIAVQKDGKIVIGGTFTTLQPNGAATTTARLRIARLNVDGTLDTAFNPGISNNAVNALAIQPDGKILVGGTFTGTVGGTTRPRLARLNADGTLDTTFDADIRNGVVNCIALQSDGNILAGGTFTSVAGVTTISRISRFLWWNGARDAGLTVTTAGGTTAVSALAVQPDGQILIGGVFTSINGTTRNRIARVSSSGVLDSVFNPNANTGTVESIALQSDGQILFGGTFTQVGGIARNRLARVTAAGTLDSFDGNIGGAVEGIVVQSDGKVLVGGAFTTVASSNPWRYLARLANNQVTETFNVPAYGDVEWYRGGSAPVVRQVWFDVSTDSGVTWTAAGAGEAISGGGWRLYSSSLPDSGIIRARGAVVGGLNGGSVGVIESQRAFNLTRVSNLVSSDAALTVPAHGTVRWAPVNLPAPVASMEFFLSADGVSWTSLGTGVNVAGEWLRTGLDLPGGGYLRVLARSTADASGASLLMESLATFTRPALPGLGAGSDPAIVANTYDRVQWLPVPVPSGVTQVVFYLSKDGGNTWTSLGWGSPISGGWEVTGLVLPLNAHIRVVATLSGTSLLTDTVAAFVRPITPGVVENDPVLANINSMTSIAQIPDGRFMVALNVPSGGYITRLNSNGSLPYPSNGASTDAPVTTISVKDDGKVIFGGEFTTVNSILPRQSYTVLKANGLVDDVAPASGSFPLPGEPDFSGTTGSIYGSVVQPDGKTILVGGFSKMEFWYYDINVHGGYTLYRNGVARLNADQTYDHDFNPPLSVTGTVYGVALQADGKILVGGDFNVIWPINIDHLYRLNSDGSMDTGFTPEFDAAVRSVVVQKDGKILVAGDFTSVIPQGATTPVACGQIVRLNSDGTLDTGFTPPTAAYISSLALQADGKILVGSDGASFVDGSTVYGPLVRLNSNGTVDSSFERYQESRISSILLQKNGRVLVGPLLRRLENTAATESFDVVETAGVYRLEWLRGGTAPELAGVTFDISTNGGTTWTPLGNGASISGGWGLDGLSALPEPALIRARGRPVTNSKSSSLLESIFTY